MAVRIRLFRVASSADASAPIGAFSPETPVSGWKNRGMALFGENNGTVGMMVGTALIQADMYAVVCSRALNLAEFAMHGSHAQVYLGEGLSLSFSK
jgi:hypothetical protein